MQNVVEILIGVGGDWPWPYCTNPWKPSTSLSWRIISKVSEWNQNADWRAGTAKWLGRTWHFRFRGSAEWIPSQHGGTTLLCRTPQRDVISGFGRGRAGQAFGQGRKGVSNLSVRRRRLRRFIAWPISRDAIGSGAATCSRMLRFGNARSHEVCRLQPNLNNNGLWTWRIGNKTNTLTIVPWPCCAPRAWCWISIPSGIV